MSSWSQRPAQSAAAEGAGFAFIDLSGAVKGYATGRPQGDPAPATAWQFGIDVAGVAEACGQVEAIGYAADPERLRLDLSAYRSIIGPGPRLSVIMRPMAPDCDSPRTWRRSWLWPASRASGRSASITTASCASSRSTLSAPL